MTSIRGANMEQKQGGRLRRCGNCRSYERSPNLHRIGCCNREDCQHYGHLLVPRHPGCRYHRAKKKE